MNGVCSLIVGAMISFGCFWYLQFGRHYDKLWGAILVVLIFSGALIAYGVYSLMA